MWNLRNNSSNNSMADEASVIRGRKYRFTILTSRLIRIEYDENGIFEDRATFTVVNRKFNPPDFKIATEGNVLKITTEHICLTYDTTSKFSQESLKVSYTGKNRAVYAGRCLPSWHFGTNPFTNLKGTVVALDNVNGACELEDGIMSLGEISVLDDSNSNVFNEEGLLEERKTNSIDQYLFCYGIAGEFYDYEAALVDYYKLTGKVPLLPRYAMGNWWCRYYAYTQDEYKSLMKRFKEEDIPFSVAVIDMDWHYVKIDPKYGGGWTGYTWNEELFPDHVELLKYLHNEGMHLGLNLHPQCGIAAHEKRYEEMADAMGVDKTNEELVEFDISDKKFLEKYFKILHHPLEKEGVDFWWIDYNTSLRELDPDPLPLINHYYYADNEKRNIRALILSRYSGPGSHRYPVGFSGDTISSWESLEFQPYFTATAANIGYTWWSHDIGGFQKGIKDDELITRWVQFGVFSPVNRLHSSNLRYMSKEPWRYNKICEMSIKKFLKLRHELIPYTYTMNYRTSRYGMPLVRPVYYEHKTHEAYETRTEYLFGTEMLVSPIVKSQDCATKLGSAEVYLPDGVWYDFFSGRRYSGNKVFTAYRDIDSMPVFVKMGGIIPMANLVNVNDTENPEKLKVKVFAGASGSFEMYEDDGISYEFENGKYAFTNMTFNWGETSVFDIEVPKQNMEFIPSIRSYEVEFIGINDCEISVLKSGKQCKFEKIYIDGILHVKIDNVEGDLKITLNNTSLCENNLLSWIDEFLENAAIEYVAKEKIYNELSSANSFAHKVNFLEHDVKDENVRAALMEIITQ